MGVVARIGVEPPDKGELKSVAEVIDLIPLIGERELQFINWISDYYLCGNGDTLRAMMSHLFSSDIQGLFCRYFKPKKKKIDGVATMIDVNLEKRRTEKLPYPKPQFTLHKSITLLHAKQKIDLPSLVASLYAEGSTVVVLAPTSHRAKLINDELEPYFATAICSQATVMKKRAALAIDCAVGLAPQVVVGTRAALGIAYGSISAVVVTEEESFRYKSQRTPQLSVRDAALMLASLHNAKSVLISEFPSVESYYNATSGSWDYIAAESTHRPLRSIILEHGKELLSKYLRRRIAETLIEGKRIILMQNRRGIASYTECTACGHVPQCSNCSTSLTVHRHLLGCHYCGTSVSMPEKCEKCGGVMELRGHGTQRIEDLITTLYPEARTVRIDSDAYADEDYKINPDWQIAIGTKMVIENVDWQNIGLASMLNIDNMLSAPDFRSSEEVFRTVGTMAARCAERDAELVIQSSALTNVDVDDAINFRYESFYTRVIEDRRAAIFPPHSRMIKLSLKGEYMPRVVEFARAAEAALRPIFAHRLSPMHQPMVERQSGDHIIEMLVKIERGRSSAKAKELIRHHLSPIIRSARKAKVAISAQSDPL